MATPAVTSAMPAMSCGVGSWRSTTAPMIAANTGSSASMSANVARGSRAMASWSVTYGMTEEHTPTPAPAASSTGWPNAGSAPARPAGVAATAAISIAMPSWSMPGPLFAIVWPSTTYTMNSTQLPNAHTNPSGCPSRRIAVIVATPAMVSASATALRQVRVPMTASSTVPRNSMAPTVDSGSRSTAR
jgi:hypothetical protein